MSSQSYFAKAQSIWWMHFIFCLSGMGLRTTKQIQCCLIDYITVFRLWTDLEGLVMQTGSFTLKQIKAATMNFDARNKIGEGGFGPVYKVSQLNHVILIFLLDSTQNSEEKLGAGSTS